MQSGSGEQQAVCDPSAGQPVVFGSRRWETKGGQEPVKVEGHVQAFVLIPKSAFFFCRMNLHIRTTLVELKALLVHDRNFGRYRF